MKKNKTESLSYQERATLAKTELEELLKKYNVKLDIVHQIVVNDIQPNQ